MNLPSTPSAEPVFTGLKSFFGDIVATPVPAQWTDLALALDAALAKGDLTRETLNSKA